ncbi:MAG: glucuronate isomerase [Phycisphaerales bacterium]
MSFIHDDFLLSCEPARRLYHGHAAGMPIYDYHCHLPPADLAANRRFETLAEIWLDGDHYKWRAMRANGVDEKLITGDADPYDRFLAWAATVPDTIRNPLYHWTHLELKRYFGIDTLLNADTAKDIWDEANRQLKQVPVSAILDKFNVALIGTTDDPADDLKHHAKIKADNTFPDTAIYPAFRPDKACATADVKAWNTYIDRIAQVSGKACDSLGALLAAIRQRHTFFHAAGSRVSDHGLTCMLQADCTTPQAESIFDRLRAGNAVTGDDTDRFTVYLMRFFGELDTQRGWVKQLHLGAMRNTNTHALKNLGPDTGFDSIGDYPQGQGLARYLGTLAERGHLPKTILYNLNPADNYLFATMAGNFQGTLGGAAGVPGRIQYGSGWWYLDQEEAMRWQINALSNTGLLSRFVGMLTDSRSFMSYPRHEYFRRVLCDMLGSDIQTGRLPADYDLIGRIVENICFNNARDYFGMQLKGRHAT